MSEVIPEEQDLIGATTHDVVADEGDASKKEGLGLTIYDAMLVISLVFITIATCRLVLVLREYNPSWPFGGGSPWSTG